MAGIHKLCLREGDVVDLTKGLTVYEMHPDRYIFSNRRNAPLSARTHHDVEVGSKHAKHLVGRFVVYKVAFDGGGTGHGPHDVYPSGHHVFCEKLDAPDVKCDFYQTGCFTATIAPGSIKPVAKARRQWVIETGETK